MASTPESTSRAEQAPDAMTALRPRALAAVALGGAFGGSARVALAEAYAPEPGALPLVILVENVIGAFLLALIATVLVERLAPRRDLRPLLCSGVLGSFTTFSTLSLDLVELALTPAALGYAALSVGLGLTAAFTGVAVGRLGASTS